MTSISTPTDNSDDTAPTAHPTPIADAALQYAANGIPIVLFDAGVGSGKQCGNLVGDSGDDDDKWYDHATTDPAVIAGWLAEFGTRATGIATSPGKADAVVLDVDKPERLTGGRWYMQMNCAPFQSTDANDDRRGHYWFDLPPGERFGNYSFPWGELRCEGGGLILAPTPHARAAQGGRYEWIRQGETTPLPEIIVDALRAKANGQQNGQRDTDRQGRGGVQPAAAGVTDADVEAWLDAHTGNDYPHGLPQVHKRFERLVDTGEMNRHNAMKDVLPWAMCEAAADGYPAREVEKLFRAAWLKVIEPDYPHHDEAEFDSLLRWAVIQAEGDDHDKRRLRMARNYGSRHDAPLNNVLPFPKGSAGEKPEGSHCANQFDSIKADVNQFWESSQELKDLRQFAQARLVGPWAMLGATLARVIAHIPPNVVLPPIVGGHASLNLFVALAGKSGEAKSAAMRASADWLKVEPHYPPSKPGSGEGLAKCFAYKRKLPHGGGWEQIGKQWSVLAQIPEIDTLTATAGRGGATIMSTLREGWSGERLGHDYAGEDKRIVLEEHRYRLCLVVGVQPLRAQPLFDDTDAGTPQRFVWFTAIDDDMPEVEPDEPTGLDLGRWEHTTGGNASGVGVVPLVDVDTNRKRQLDDTADPADFEVLNVPDIARDEIKMVQRKIRRGNADADPLDGHRLLVQLKIAAALMVLEGRRHTITESDWQRAGLIMAVSDVTRNAVQTELKSKVHHENANRGRAEGERELAKIEVIEQDRERVKNMADRIREALTVEDGQTLRTLGKSLSGGNKNRHIFDRAVLYLIASDVIRREDFITRNKQESTRLWLV